MMISCRIFHLKWGAGIKSLDGYMRSGLVRLLSFYFSTETLNIVLNRVSPFSLYISSRQSVLEGCP